MHIQIYVIESNDALRGFLSYSWTWGALKRVGLVITRAEQMRRYHLDSVVSQTLDNYDPTFSWECVCFYWPRQRVT